MFVRAACGDDRELQNEVESLLAAHAAAGGFAEGPAIEGLAPSAAVSLRDGAWAEADLQALHPGVRLGKYRIERQLGHGGMGVVFLAHDATLDRGVAIKVLGRRDDDEASHARLLREARKRLRAQPPEHLHGLRGGRRQRLGVYRHGIRRRPFVARSRRWRLAPGGGRRSIRDRGCRRARARARSRRRASRSQGGECHRLASDRLKIVDFGLARRTDALMSDATTEASIVGVGVAVGTPYAMAPEQVRGDSQPMRAPIFGRSASCCTKCCWARDRSTVRRLRNCFRPFCETRRRRGRRACPTRCAEIVHKCLAKDPAERYQRAADVRLVLEAVASGLRRRDVPSDPRVVNRGASAHRLLCSA